MYASRKEKLHWKKKADVVQVQNMVKPLVSICVPTYNSARYLLPCLDSIVAQTYDNIEVIFSDNASKDDTVAILQDYVNLHGHALSLNAANIGAGANFNKLVGLAKGEYIAIYHADDVYRDTIVEESVKVLQNNPSVGLVGTMGTVIDSDGKFQYDIQLHNEIKSLNKAVYTFDEALVGAIRNMFVTPTIMVRAKAYQELGDFDYKKYKSACDYEMWLRIARKYQVAVIDKKLINYRIHEGQGSEHEVRKNIEIPDILWVLKEYRQFVNDKKISKCCDNIVDNWIFKAAKKQNRLGYYSKSTETLQLLNLKKYWFPKYMYKALNMMHLSPKKRKL